MFSMTYECAICLNVNHAAKLHCSCCGTVPAKYSILRLPTRILEEENVSSFIPAVVARGADRAEHHRCSRRQGFQTVKADYYAEKGN